MSKAILVMDMPESCFYCDCCHTKPYDNKYKIDGEKFCGILNEDVGAYYYHGGEKPEFCPLRETPKQREIFNNCDDYLNGIDDGWNACIDEILGEK